MTKSLICKLFGVSRQLYYRRKWSVSRRRATASDVVASVESVRSEMPRIGVRKLYHILKPHMREMSVGRDRLFSILRANGMLVKPVRSYHVTTNSHHRFHKHKNLLANMKITRPEQAWVSDITYVGSRGRHMYLALITDAYSKRIMGYDLSDSLSTEGAIKALKMANRSRIYKAEPLVHHSDRGIQYCSGAYQRLLGKYKIVPSMTESYDPYANAVAERVNGILKQEFLLEECNLNLSDMKDLIADVVETYNTRRPHCSCSMLTPELMHRQSSIDIITYKKSVSTELQTVETL